MDRTTTETLEHRMLHRLVFFTDAVFAIVMTLLVLELRPPHTQDLGELREALGGMAGHFVAFAMSFGLIGVFWAAHMNTTRRLLRFDWPTAWMNLVFLFPVCLMPFASALLGGGLGNAVSWTFYCWVLVGASAANVALTLVATRGGGRLVGGVTPRERLYRVARAASPGLAFGLSLVLANVGQLGIAHWMWLTIPLFMLAADLLVKPRAPAPTPVKAPARRKR
ncbi:MAG: TMEM175 family protein [Phenylobacterium sp.]